MSTLRTTLIAAAAMFAVAVASPVGAQTQSWGFGLHTGWLNSGSLGEGAPNDMDLKLDDGMALGGGLEWWFGARRFGLRADASYTDQPYELQSGEHEPTWITNTSQGSGTTVSGLPQLGNVDTWFADASLMLRLLRPTVDNKFAPFLSLGGGFIRWDHEDEANGAFVNEADTYIQGNAQAEWVLSGGIGADFFLTDNLALRFELKDYWNASSPYTFASDDTRHQQGSHNQIASLGLQFMFGGERVREPGFISVAPEPAPEPTPVAEPVPTFERVSMCVVEENGQLRSISASRNPLDNQVYVTHNGQEVTFTTVYPAREPLYIKGAPWYVASRPLILELEADDMGGDVDDEIDDAIEQMPENRLEFVNFGSTQPLATGEVLYVGSIDGTPLYATRSDIGGFMSELQGKLAVSTDLDDILDDEAFADRYVTEIQTFYMAVEPGTVNCVFQPVSSTRVVRRTRG